MNMYNTSTSKGPSKAGNDEFDEVAIYYKGLIDGSLSELIVPVSIDSVGAYAFYYCDSLKEVTFKGTPTEVASSAFYNCTALKTINVPWAEGAVAGAPWGATGATINYNYTE